MSKEKAGLALLTGGASLLFLAACGSGGDSEGPTTLEGAESSLTDTQVSREAARAAAKACFDTYAACDAASHDDHVCREELEDCLRDVADVPRECEPGPPHEARHGAEHSDDHDGDIDEGHHHHHHQKHKHHHKHRHHKHYCHSPIPERALHQCREEVEYDLEEGQDLTAVSAAYDQCVLDAFADGIAKLCDKIDALCANPNAPADACDRITGACNMP